MKNGYLHRHMGQEMTAKEAILHMFDGGRIVASDGDGNLEMLRWDEDRGFIDTENASVLMTGALKDQARIWEYERERDVRDIVCCDGPISEEDARKLSRMSDEDFQKSLMEAYDSGEVRRDWHDKKLHWCLE